MFPSKAVGWGLRALVATAVIVVSIIAGAEWRSAREQSIAAARPSPSPSLIASPSLTPLPTPRATLTPPSPSPVITPSHPATTTPAIALTPTPRPTATSPRTVIAISGRVTAGGRPVALAQIRVFPANEFQNGPTPVPPLAGDATTGDDGTYRVELPAGSYKVGAYLPEQSATVTRDGFYSVTWYGDAYAIGWSKPVLVAGETKGIDIAMLHSVTISGRVVGRDGVGVPNATITTSVQSNVTYPLNGATTDASGAYSLRTVGMKMTIAAMASGKSEAAGVFKEIDVRGDMSIDLVIDRGNILSGILRDATGAPLPNFDFSVAAGAMNFSCAYSCNARTDAAGRYAVTVPSGTLHFFTWPKTPGDHEYRSPDYAISSDSKLDPTLR